MTIFDVEQGIEMVTPEQLRNVAHRQGAGERVAGLHIGEAGREASGVGVRGKSRCVQGDGLLKITRAWAMPNHSTFEIEPIAALIGRYIAKGGRWVDPFARTSRFAQFCEATNDLDPAMPTTHHMEALDFLRQFEEATIDGVLFDPPYSNRQISECYQGVGRAVHTEDTQSSFYGDRKREVARIVRPGGIAMCFGWNSGGIGERNGFDLIEVLIVAHGGAHNDTIVTVERKRCGLFDQMEAA